MNIVPFIDKKLQISYDFLILSDVHFPLTFTMYANKTLNKVQVHAFFFIFHRRR